LDDFPEDGLSNTFAAALAARLPVPCFIVESPLAEKSMASAIAEDGTISRAKWNVVSHLQLV
jgi:hypothetical protein